MNNYNDCELKNAVTAICPDICERVRDASIQKDDRRLWWELSSCILSSQVPYPLSIAAADAIDSDGVLHDKRASVAARIERLQRLLSVPLSVNGRWRTYRFPVARARQMAAAYSVVTDTKCTLGELINSFADATAARGWFVKHIPGIGPKQASMFLRNAGVTYDLAILDRHVLNYMSKLGLYSGDKYSISGLARYQRHEDTLKKHAEELDCPVGLLDWAIWIVMRVANQTKEATTV